MSKGKVFVTATIVASLVFVCSVQGSAEAGDTGTQTRCMLDKCQAPVLACAVTEDCQSYLECMGACSDAGGKPAKCGTACGKGKSYLASQAGWDVIICAITYCV